MPGKCADFCSFLYNSEEGTVIGRTASSWGMRDMDEFCEIGLIFIL